METKNDPTSNEVGSFSILSGIETEYGFTVSNRGVETQVDDATRFVSAYPGPAWKGWDYALESPRSDLRGFVLDRLEVDPVDARLDQNRQPTDVIQLRADRILTNGARFYNDHGHPEYATPECFGLQELVLHDKAGERVVLEAARQLSEQLGEDVQVYKNNTDFHGSSYGTHESYLAPRELGFAGLFPALLPMLIVRQVLTGAGKVGYESGAKCNYQMSVRADHFVEPANAETLWRRPIFNTRDEPHARRQDWIRVHVISGDANMIPSATFRKAGLVKIAILLAQKGTAPKWEINDPVATFQMISRSALTGLPPIGLAKRNWTTIEEIYESYFTAAEQTLELDTELQSVIDECRLLLTDLNRSRELSRQKIDWVAKQHVLEQVMEMENYGWDSPELKSYDLMYHNVDPDEGLYFSLAEMNAAESYPSIPEVLDRLSGNPEGSRARARAIAVEKHSQYLKSAGWQRLVFDVDGKQEIVELDPAVHYSAELSDLSDVRMFIQCLKSLH